MKKPAALLVIACSVSPHASADNDCHAVKTWSDVPQSVRANLTDSVGSIAETGEDFNPSDIVFNDTPQSRFFGGCLNGNKLVLAIERGGRGYFLELFEFVNGVRTRSWGRTVPETGFKPELAVPPAER